MGDTVLVTGIGGHVGQHCAAEFLHQGLRVRGSLRNARSADAVRNGIARVAPAERLGFVAPNLHTYVRSKTLAERAAWDLAREHPEEPEVVTINPGAVYGPTLTGNAGGQSLKWVAAILRGKVPPFARFHVTIVDVRDVALLHVRAMIQPGADGVILNERRLRARMPDGVTPRRRPVRAASDRRSWRGGAPPAHARRRPPFAHGC